LKTLSYLLAIIFVCVSSACSQAGETKERIEDLTSSMEEEQSFPPLETGETTVIGTDEMFSARYDGNLLVFSGELYLIGGKYQPGGVQSLLTSSTQDTTVYNEIWKSSDGIRWERITKNFLEPTRVAQAATVFNNQIVVIGGQYDRILSDNIVREYLNDIWTSQDAITWARLQNSSEFTPRIHHELVIYKDKIWLIGGRRKRNSPRVDIWNSSDLTAFQIVSTPFDIDSILVSHKVLEFKNNIILFDTKTGIQKSQDGIIWEKVELSEETANGLLIERTDIGNRSGYGLVNFYDQLMLFGGGGLATFESIGTGLFNDVWASDDGENWNLLVKSSADGEPNPQFADVLRTHYDSFPARRDFYYTIFQDHIFMIGGRDANGNWLPETWVSPNGSDWYLLARVEE
jgi:hypothetical protein